MTIEFSLCIVFLRILAGPERSQLVQRFAAGTCLESCRLFQCVLNLLRNFLEFEDLHHYLWFTRVDDLFNDSFWDPGTSRSIGT